MTAQHRIVLDCDTGIDDALAILYALQHPAITLEAVSCVYGNTFVEVATRNTLSLLELAGKPDIPVAMGARRALTRPFAGGPTHIHGENAFGDVSLPVPTVEPSPLWGPDLIIALARAHPGELTLVPTGPITNVALALMKAPEIARLYRRIVVMGGSLFHPGVPRIASPMADANFFNDPEAARIVLQSGAEITLVGMDVTMKTLFTEAQIAQIEAEGTAATRAAATASRFYLNAYRKQYPGIAGCALHDPLAVAVVEDPTLVRTEPMQLDIETRGELTRGQVVPDRRATGTTAPNADVCLDVDAARFVTRFVALMCGRPPTG